MPSGIYIRTEQCIENLLKRPQVFKKGSIPWNKGLNIQLNSGITHFKKGMIPWGKGKKRPEIMGENHPKWRGDNVGYDALHSWVSRKLGKPHKCEICGVEKTGKNMHWANKDHSYKRNLTDWISLCRRCHREYDKNLCKK